MDYSKVPKVKQDKILNNLDELIALTEKQVELFKQMKKGFKQQFDPIQQKNFKS